VDTKKKELVGDFKNAGQEWQKKREPVKVRVHDFADPALGKAAPYGVYDLAANQGWISVGIDHDTAKFAVESIRRWWNQMGKPRYPKATRLLITADCGGSNGYRLRLWKVALQRFADETGLTLQVCHLPPGTSKWNKIEHRMFCHITKNWRGKPLESLAVIVNLIGNTTTTRGLKIRAEIDASQYPKGQKISDEEMKRIQLHPDPLCSEASKRSSRWKSCRWRYPDATVVIPDGEKGDRLVRKLGSKSLGWLGAVHPVRSARGEQLNPAVARERTRKPRNWGPREAD
jgi:Rhodopirellula transposase DDE domain